MDFGATLTLNDNFTATMRKAIKTEQDFKKETLKLHEQLKSTIDRKRQMKIDKTQAERNIKQIKAELKTLAKARFKPILELKDRASATIKDITKKLKNLVANKFTITAVIAGLGVGLTKSIQSGSLLEQQEIAMEHFITVNTKGTGIDPVKEREKFIADLRKNAMITPFTTAEVISAGARAINIAQGDTRQAMELVELAEDMAALNPEKSLMDAMEALADARMGEFERMKEFGFKISAEEFKGYVGKGSSDALTDEEVAEAYSQLVEQKLRPYFAGGAEKLSQSGAGMFNVITGAIGSEMQDIGRGMIEALKSPLKDLMAMTDGLAGKGKKLGETIGAWITKGYQRVKDMLPTIDKMREGFKQALNIVKTVGTPVIGIINNLKEALKSVWNIVQPYVIMIKDLLVPALQGISSVALWISERIKGIMSILESMDWVLPFILGIVGAWKAYAIAMGVVTGIKKAYLAIVNAIEIAQIALNIAMTASPVGWIITAIGALIGVGILLYKNWDKVSKWWTSMWDKMKNAFSNFVLGIKKTIADLLDKIPDFLLPDGIKEWKKKVKLEYEERKQQEELIKAQQMANDEIVDSLKKIEEDKKLNQIDSSVIDLNEYKQINGIEPAVSVESDLKPFEPISNVVEGSSVTGNQKAQAGSGSVGGMVYVSIDMKGSIIREEADIERLAREFALKLREAQINYGGVMDDRVLAG